MMAPDTATAPSIPSRTVVLLDPLPSPRLPPEPVFGSRIPTGMVGVAWAGRTVFTTVGVFVGVLVGVAVGCGVVVGVLVGVSVGVLVAVGVFVGVSVGVLVAVGV